MDEKLCVIGLGKMGSTLVKGLIQTKTLKREQIIGTDVFEYDSERNSNYCDIKTMSDNAKAVKESDIVLLAVKPQVIDEVLEEISPFCENKIVISIAAGVSLRHLDKALPVSSKIIRAMPNTPILVGEGVIAISKKKNVDENDLRTVKKILESVGKVYLVEEYMMDAITALSGSGPAYVYIMIEALSDGGVLMGLPRELSTEFAARTLLGAARMVLETQKHPGELKDMVTSPGGTSIKGIEVLESHGLRGILMDAVKEATIRSKELNSQRGVDID
ncbi:pyrroline-5-carboxylate reductase [Petrotoga mexicana DSM 14811]|jgi:pyrroline-5-carboxylate reductase|uniref:Pyrroline-5-carboxylate reductase n=1 Tax=Petrotoga mexicana DSM 14811 TaxID=1122954 RepID=A0A2K1PDB7_9BACT|nr:pyrroline-5-carboxylate reductase [Petrotoga mexicana]PNS00813.1 pyrroline-5-carboxylate reductase [Petrotoga mexicana DSM 14811]